MEELMKNSSYCALWLGALISASATLTGHAQAQSCASDTDCGDGFECKTQSYESCTGGGWCSPEGCFDTEYTCETVEYTYCSNKTCVTNADCPATMGCQAQTRWECDGGGAGGSGGSAGTGASGAGGTAGMYPAGAGGAAGGIAEDAGVEDPCLPDGTGCMPSCHEAPADSICIPRYQLPCETASDCGGGFDCVESFYTICTGGGSAGMGGAGGTGGAGGEPIDSGVIDGEYTCEEVSNGINTCELQVIACETHADCPAGLECQGHYEYPPCTIVGGSGGSAGTGVGMGGAGGVGGDGDGDGDGGGYYYECPDPIVEQRCMPPQYEGGMGGTGGTSGSGSGGSTAGSGSAGFGGMGGAGGAAGAAGMSSDGSGNAGTGAPSDDDGEADEHRGQHGKHKGLLKRLLGCSTSGPISGNGATGSWLMLGLAALVIGRRARRG